MLKSLMNHEARGYFYFLKVFPNAVIPVAFSYCIESSSRSLLRPLCIFWIMGSPFLCTKNQTWGVSSITYISSLPTYFSCGFSTFRCQDKAVYLSSSSYSLSIPPACCKKWKNNFIFILSSNTFPAKSEAIGMAMDDIFHVFFFCCSPTLM